MKEVQITKGAVAVVDDEDFDLVSGFSWNLQENKYGNRYAKTSVPIVGENGKKRQTTTTMHRVIMGLRYGDGLSVDHIDGNGLNNRRSNLRVCTHSENLMNRRRTKNKYRGVRKTNNANRWTAKITVKGVEHYLGCFKTPEEAALAYNEASVKYHGEFGQINAHAG